MDGATRPCPGGIPDHLISQPPTPLVTFGLATDIHYADRATSGTRYYRHGLPKMQDAVASWVAAGAGFAIEIGDLTDHYGAGSAAIALADLGTIDAAFSGVGETFYAFGNHCQDKLTKAEIIAATSMPAPYYSFDRGGVHFVVLDSNYSADSDGASYGAGGFAWDVNFIPPTERAWLEADLAATEFPTLIFCHYRLHASGQYYVNNASAVRAIMEASGKVKGVFTGHNHINDFDVVNGIPYFAMMAMTEGAYPTNAYAVVRVMSDGAVVIDGYGQQVSRP
jgi:3',5'-cyclic AMP phosphodiesterase CpdA